MRKISFLFICLAFCVSAKAQSLKESDFNSDDKGRPAIDRIFRTADGSRSLTYYTDATVSFSNNKKYTKPFVVHNIAQPLSMIIVREDGQPNDVLYYSAEKSSYTDKSTGMEYLLDKKSIRKMNTSK